MDGQQRGRLGSEQIAYLSIGLLGWLVEYHTGRSIKVYMATDREDLRKGTDVGLILPRSRGHEYVVFLDVTLANQRRVGEKIRRSGERAKAGGRYVEIVQLELTPTVTAALTHSSLLRVFAALRSESRTNFSPADIIENGGDLKFVRSLISLGGEIVMKLGHRPGYQGYFKVDDTWVWHLPIPDELIAD